MEEWIEASKDVSVMNSGAYHDAPLSYVLPHHPADVDYHSAPPGIPRKRDLSCDLKLWQAYETAGASAALLDVCFVNTPPVM